MLDWNAFVSAKDTLAQWIMALFGVVATAISVYAVVLLNRNLVAARAAVAQAEEGTRAAHVGAEAAREANAIAREMGETQTRAYLSVVGGEIVYRNNFKPIVNLIIRNDGPSPALNVRARYKISDDTILTETPTGQKSGIKVQDYKLSLRIGPNTEEVLSIGIVKDIVVSEEAVRERIMVDFYIEGIIEYQTIFGAKHDIVDTDTTFLLLNTTKRTKLINHIIAGAESRHSMQLMPAFKSGWVVDYQRTIAAIREGERNDKAKADAKKA